jgi:hypothetical protein
MTFIVSLLAYLGSVTGISVGLLMLACAFFASPRPPTLLPHGQTTTAAQTEPTLHKAALSRILKTDSHRQSESRAGPQTSAAGRVRYAVNGVSALHRQKSRDRENEWAYRHEPVGFSGRANYAQALSGDFSRAR